MRRTRALLPALVGSLVLLATACGSDEASTASDPASGEVSSTSSGSESSPGDPGDALVEPSLEGLIALTAAGGEVTTTPTPVDTVEQQAAYLADFDQRMSGRLRAAVLTLSVPPGATLTATVVAVGCESPETVDITRTDDGWTVVAPPTKGPEVQCFAPITTVALVLLPR